MSAHFRGSIRAFAALACICLAMMGNPAVAALDCEQLVAVAQATVKLRDEGLSLNAVLRDFDSGEATKKFNAQEMNLLRQTVRVCFTSEASVYEIAESCKAGELGLPKPKSKP